MGPQAICVGFWGKKKFFLRIGKTVFNLLYKSAHSLPTPVIYGASF